MKNAVLINAYPKNKKKQDILERSVIQFKKLGLIIVVVSGCDIPDHISKHIDYYIINREKLVLDKSYMTMCNRLFGYQNNIACPYLQINNLFVFSYFSNHNPTIARNTKLVFEFAKSLGIENVLYTEDDNIFNESSFDFVKTHLDLLNTNKTKFISGWGTMVDSGTPMLFSFMFFANIDFFLKHFKIPTTIEGWYNEDNIRKYNLHRAYEESLYQCFLPVKDQTHNFITECDMVNRSGAIEGNLNSRYETLEWRIETLFNVFKQFNSSNLFFIAWNYTVSTSEQKSIDLKIEIDDVVCFDRTMNPNEWYYQKVTNNNKIVLYVNNEIKKEINLKDVESIEHNGTIIIN